MFRPRLYCRIQEIHWKSAVLRRKYLKHLCCRQKSFSKKPVF